MAVIGLAAKPGVDKVVVLAEQVFAWARDNGHSIILEEGTSSYFNSSYESLPASELTLKADPIITLGGDGTMIGVARHTQSKSPLMIGVKFGTLGFLTEIPPADLIDCLDSVFKNKVEYSQRSMISVKVERDSKEILSSQAVNDVVIQKGATARLLDLDVFCDDKAVMRIRGDGLIFSTPTGSTAYSMASGGSIVHPDLEVMLLTPICPHSLTNRPLILPLDSRVTIKVPEFEGNLYALVDGQVSVNLKSNDSIEITESKNKVKFVKSPSKTYFDILRSKLNWGTAPVID